MTNNPFLNAIAAVLYIVLVATFMYFAPQVWGDTRIVPIGFIAGFLSLFVFSAAAMSFFFFYTPFKMYFGEQKKEAISLFLKTALYFALIAVVVFAAFLALSPELPPVEQAIELQD